MMSPKARDAVNSEAVGDPSGSYSHGIRVGELLFLAGQVASLPDGTVRRDSVAGQVRQALRNLDAAAVAGGSALTNAVQVRVYLRDLADFEEMDAEYRTHFAHPLPARTTIQSNFTDFDVEIDAIVQVSGRGGSGDPLRSDPDQGSTA